MENVTPRLPIRKIGQVLLNDSGGAHLEGWKFGTDMLTPGDTMNSEVLGDTLNGWHVTELHVIAHGAPCDCPVGRLFSS